MKTTLIIIAAVFVVYVVSVLIWKGPLTKLLGEARINPPRIDPGFDIHAVNRIQGGHVDRDARLEGVSGSIIREWADRDFVDWEKESKVTAPRIILAKLFAGNDVDEVNTYLLNATPNRPSGSSWELRPVADYDFCEIVLSAILSQFGEDQDVLRSETVDHLVDVLIIETGYHIRYTVPGSLGLVRETENHILMTEGSRYLRNLWIAKHRSFDRRHVRRTARHAATLTKFVTELEHSGMYEFNSVPYSGYTMAALLILDSYAEDPDLREAVRRLLDRLSYQYALASLELRRVVPFRRQLARSSETAFTADPMMAAMIAWFGNDFGYSGPEDFGNRHHALIAAAMPYRPGAAVQRELEPSTQARLVRFGRGHRASPEIHSLGPGYVLSAGGVSWGPKSGITARPTTLLLLDGATTRDECFSISGNGVFTSWNNTGVHLDFACGTGEINMPAGYSPEAVAGGFEVYVPDTASTLHVLVYQRPGIGILAVVPEWDGTAEALTYRVADSNADEMLLRTTFTHPNGIVYEYDLQAKRGTWVMRKFDGTELPRTYREWARLSFSTSE